MGSLIQRLFSWRAAVPAAVILGVVALVAVWPGPGATPSAGAGDTSAIPARERSWIVDGAPAPQQAAVSDLKIDRSEYVAAISAERACMAEKGVATTEPEWKGNQLVYTFGGAPTREGLAAPRAIYLECHELYGRRVAVGWAIGSSAAP